MGTRAQALLWALFVVSGVSAVMYFGHHYATAVVVEDDTQPGGVCELHQAPYAVEVIAVQYGYPDKPKRTEEQRKWLEEERVAWRKSFPYSHVASGAGGCVVREAKFAKVNYCPDCRKADEA